ncbi:hypothetical protein J8273_7536 [Carpediemonas membranifera]|uniref:Uncharacterized protein n=1 Tax=Carpediemonas membranifera TaxID=201153 RepID=A0A8J6B1Y1_9EUKA|nr:hypothetical protein J8273_7536 [Carpediemonas membranifera]|eukprot:KAG9391262.1 hypothetical protein J8273_7536 [Carpediemonas membranifera]
MAMDAAKTDLISVLDQLQAHWTVLEAELEEINGDIANLEACVKKYGDNFLPNVQFLKELRQTKKTRMKHIIESMDAFNQNLIGSRRLIKTLETQPLVGSGPTAPQVLPARQFDIVGKPARQRMKQGWIWLEVAVFAIVGALTRYFLEVLTRSFMGISNWAPNALGGFYMGAIASSHVSLDDKATSILSTALGAGLAGSTSTFSSLFVGHVTRDGDSLVKYIPGLQIVPYLTCVALCYACYRWGRQLTITPTMIAVVAVLVAVGVISCDSFIHSDLRVALILVASPCAVLGATVRLYLAGQLDSRLANRCLGLPVGTLLVNVAGSGLAMALAVCARRTGWVWVGHASSGLCGALTTLSSLAKQLSGMGMGRALLYLCLTTGLAYTVVTAVVAVDEAL